MNGRLASPALALLCLALSAPGPEDAPPAGPVAAGTDPAASETDPEAGPRRSALVETAATRLFQIDATLSGPPGIIANLTADDFELKLGFKRVRSFELDRFCGGPEAPGAVPPPTLDEPYAPPQVEGFRRASFVFYLDQPHLTAVGRRHALQTVRELIPRLVRDGHQGTLISDSRRLHTVAPFTTDAAVLLRAVDDVESDPAHWDFFGIQEDQRVQQLITTLNREGDLGLAITRARWNQQEERSRSEKSFRRLESVLARLAEVDQPKALLYFADTQRSNAGEHYLGFFSEGTLRRNVKLSMIEADARTAALAFDRVVNQAAAQGVRLYTVHPSGLAAYLDTTGLSDSALELTGSATYTSRTRTVHAENTLASMATETGGRAFLHGARASKIVERIRADLSCLYLISFDPEPYSKDKPHRVVVKVNVPGVTVRARGRVVLQSESARLASRLLGAFSAPDAAANELAVSCHLVPTAFENGRYTALVQVTIPGMPLAGTTWDMGASLLAGDKVHAETSGRLSVSGPGVPLVLESEMSFPPGQYRVVAVAHEAKTDLVASEAREDEWSNPNRGAASVGSISLLQPQAGAFLRDGSVRDFGSLARDRHEPVRADRPTALVGLVCRGRSKQAALRVERTLLGASEVRFPPIDLQVDERGCAQVRDLIPADTMGPGSYSYRVRILDERDVLDSGERSFEVLDGES